jgi:hypothetical protein
MIEEQQYKREFTPKLGEEQEYGKKDVSPQRSEDLASSRIAEKSEYLQWDFKKASKALKKKPNSLQALYRLGILYIEKKEWT